MGNDAANNQHECYAFGTDSETPVRLSGYETDAWSDLLIEHLRAHVGGAGRGGPPGGEAGDGSEDDFQPFFAVLSVQPPHGPNFTPTNPVYGAPRLHPATLQLRRNVPDVPWIRERTRLGLAGYYAMVENLDYNIGRIRSALTEMGVDRDTYVIFFSDHGDMMGSHGQFGKSSPWEESIRIPFLVHRTGGAYNMRTGACDAPINHVDIAPTTLGLCSIPVPGVMVGFDYSAHCKRPDAPEYNGAPQPAREPQSAYLQQIPPKLMRHTVNRPWRGVVTRDGWKYACTPATTGSFSTQPRIRTSRPTTSTTRRFSHRRSAATASWPTGSPPPATASPSPISPGTGTRSRRRRRRQRGRTSPRTRHRRGMIWSNACTR